MFIQRLMGCNNKQVFLLDIKKKKYYFLGFVQNVFVLSFHLISYHFSKLLTKISFLDK